MKLPRNVSGATLQASLRRLGYNTVRQRGSHVRITTVEELLRELGRHSALKPYPDYKDSGVQVAGEGAGALGGATAAHQSFWDNGPRS